MWYTLFSNKLHTVPSVGVCGHKCVHVSFFPRIQTIITPLGSRDSSVVRVPDSWLKGHRFESLQEWQKFIYQLTFCTDSFRYPFHPHVTVVACKRPWSFCQKCRCQVTAEHPWTLHVLLCMKWHGAWFYVYMECAETAAVSCGTSHVRGVNSPLWWIFKSML